MLLTSEVMNTICDVEIFRFPWSDHNGLSYTATYNNNAGFTFMVGEGEQCISVAIVTADCHDGYFFSNLIEEYLGIGKAGKGYWDYKVPIADPKLIEKLKKAIPAVHKMMSERDFREGLPEYYGGAHNE